MIKDIGTAISAIIMMALPLWWLVSVETSLSSIAKSLKKIAKEKEEC